MKHLDLGEVKRYTEGMHNTENLAGTSEADNHKILQLWARCNFVNCTMFSNDTVSLITLVFLCD